EEPSTRKTWSPFFGARAAGGALRALAADWLGIASDLTPEARFCHRFGSAVHRSSHGFPRPKRACKVAVMRFAAEPLTIDPALPDLTAALRAGSAAVLVAPPGAGKTTRVPLVLAAEPWAAGKKLIVLEPRRLAARAAAARMAATLGEAVGA